MSQNPTQEQHLAAARTNAQDLTGVLARALALPNPENTGGQAERQGEEP